MNILFLDIHIHINLVLLQDMLFLIIYLPAGVLHCQNVKLFETSFQYPSEAIGFIVPKLLHEAPYGQGAHL